MRKPTDICLLCQAAPADKTNSHILPRFISTNFLQEPGKGRRGYEIGADQVQGRKAKVIQDSPKENYILCSSCESFLSIIEGLAADTFKNWRFHLTNGDFSEKKILPPHLSLINCGINNALPSRILIYSMFWRASISSHPLFDGYNLNKQLQESLRTSILSIKGENRAEVIEKINTIKVILHPYTALTSFNFIDSTANSLAAISDNIPASLNVDEFGFLLFPDIASITPEIISPLSNIKELDHYFVVLDKDLWHSIMVKRLIDEVVTRNK